jgi:glutamine amidotransferase
MTKIPFTSFLRAGSGAVVSQAISIACIPVLFRYYRPEDFGVWALSVAIAVSLGSLSTVRYELAIVVERERDRASSAFWLAVIAGLTLSAIATACLMVVYFFFEELWSQYTSNPPYVLAAWIILIAVGQALQGWILRAGDFATYSQTQIGNSVVSNSIFLIGAWGSRDVSWLIVGSITGLATALLISLKRILVSPPLGLAASWPQLWKIAKFHYRFPFFSLPYTLFSIVRERLPIMLLGTTVSTTQMGWYSQALRLTNIPVGLSSSAVRPVMFHAGASEGLKPQEKRVASILVLIAVIGAPWLGILSYDSRHIVATVVGDQWREAGPLVLALALPALLFAMSNWMDRFFDLSGKQYINLVTEFLTATLSVASLMWVLSTGGSLLQAAQAQAVALSVCYLAVMAVAFRIAGFAYFILLKVLLVVFVVASVFAALTYILGAIFSHNSGPWIAVVVSALFCLTCFVRARRAWESSEAVSPKAVLPQTVVDEDAIVIVDYGVGNLGALSNMLEFLGYDCEISRDATRIATARKLILPGVGAFDHAMGNLRQSGLIPALEEAALKRKVPVLGVCLGMQLLGQGSEEGNLPGLGWIKATARKIEPSRESKLKVPHMGWSDLAVVRASPLFAKAPLDSRFYFAHSYHVVCDHSEDMLAVANYGTQICCAVNSGNIFGVQFHPEKSHKFGMAILKAFAEYK